MLAGELGFPVGDPFFNGETEVPRGAKEVDVIGQEEVIADKPGVCGAPNGDEGIMNCFGGEPVCGTNGADGEEKDGGLVRIDFDGLRRSVATDV